MKYIVKKRFLMGAKLKNAGEVLSMPSEHAKEYLKLGVIEEYIEQAMLEEKTEKAVKRTRKRKIED